MIIDALIKPPVSFLRSLQMMTSIFLPNLAPGSISEKVPRGNNTRDTPVSPQKSPQRYPGLFKLASDVKMKCLKGGIRGNERFLPNNKLQELVTRDNILLALQDTTIDQNRHEDFAAWILENGMRLFLILVLLTSDSEEHLSSLEELMDDSVKDSALPLEFAEDEPYYGYSIAGGAEGSPKFHAFRDWKDNNLILFKIYQWIFLAPTMGASPKFRHQLPREQPLPLLNLVKKPTNSILGEIICAEIHPAHISSQRLPTLGVNGTSLQSIPVLAKLIQPSDKLSPFFDMDTGKFKAAHPIISPRRIRPIAAYEKNGEDLVIFQWVDNDSSLN
ncbi:hypothetical protein F4777DRAFT_578273 [Nemania sp. FL0916]|nr:hypothetical protein F4777DRAFT_578273 [Nemania sp. FL0916]